MKNDMITRITFNWSAIFFMWGIIVYVALDIHARFWSFDDSYVTAVTSSSTLFAGDVISSETVLSLLALMIAFAGLLSFIFKKLVQQDLETKIYSLAQAERLASKIEARITLTNTMGSLHIYTRDIYNSMVISSNHPNHNQCLLNPIDVYKKLNEFKNSYLIQAVEGSKSALYLTEKLHDEVHGDVILKAKNNRAYMIVLKYINDNDSVLDEEKGKALYIRDELKELLVSDNFSSYFDITEEHKAQFRDTCGEIDRVFGSGEGPSSVKVFIKDLHRSTINFIKSFK